MKNPLSGCCEAPVFTNCSDEGTCYYICRSCHGACDIWQDHTSFWQSNRAEKWERTKRYANQVIKKYEKTLRRLANE